MIRKLLSLVVIAVLLSACSSYSKRSTNKLSTDKLSVQISEHHAFKLLSPKSLNKQLSLTQLVEIRFNNQNHELMMQIEISVDKIVVVGLSAEGARLFSLIYDGNSIINDGYSDIIKSLKAEYLLADLQLSLWPFDSVNAQFQRTNQCEKVVKSNNTSTCEVRESDDHLNRQVLVNNEVLVNIDYQNETHYKGALTIVNKQRGYQLTITSLQVIELESPS